MASISNSVGAPRSPPSWNSTGHPDPGQDLGLPGEGTLGGMARGLDDDAPGRHGAAWEPPRDCHGPPTTLVFAEHPTPSSALPDGSRPLHAFGAPGPVGAGGCPPDP